MMLSKVSSIALIVLISLALITKPLKAQNAPEDFLNAHNEARAEVGVVPMTWEPELAFYAQGYTCNYLVESGGRPYGENFLWGSFNVSARDALDAWVSEKAFYDFDSKTCAHGQFCREYAQVVWPNSVRLGCAKVSCYGEGFLIACNYDPPANFADGMARIRMILEQLHHNRK